MVVGVKYLLKMIIMYMIDKRNILRRWKCVIFGVEKIWYLYYSIIV